MKTIVLLLALLLGDSAQACVARASTNFRDVFLADAIIVGQVINYRVDSSSGGPANLLIAPVEVLAGDIAPHLDGDGLLPVMWSNSTYGLPDPSWFRIARRPTYVIALNMTPDRWRMGFEGGGTASILQRACADPLVFAGDGPVGFLLRQVYQAPEEQRPELIDDLLAFAEQTGIRLRTAQDFPNLIPFSERVRGSEGRVSEVVEI